MTISIPRPISNGVKNKAFIFDMDGVLVNSERAWEQFEIPMLHALLGKKITENIGDTVGLGIHGAYKRALEAGATTSKNEITRGYDSISEDVYANSPVTKGLEKLCKRLIELRYKIGLVTQSPQRWIDIVMPHISFREKFEAVISLDEHPELRLKPSPDGFLEALRILEADPKCSFVLEDSNAGIAAGKAAGCYTIGFRGNLPPDYVQTGADTYADTMDEVLTIVENQI